MDETTVERHQKHTIIYNIRYKGAYEILIFADKPVFYPFIISGINFFHKEVLLLNWLAFLCFIQNVCFHYKLTEVIISIW